ncbi:alpha-L-rhamnosidase C-terminal domain-containing protein [Aeromicrobium stalagmiti]|uniref:alpha-L-rhamnosidase-related protein n=1 Tax=Aeromicrobium stalagmiti TaxID=2738988 RepID=UPI0015691F71|nr:hypothetical protein [Aeromicrobium stalagmiti]
MIRRLLSRPVVVIATATSVALVPAWVAASPRQPDKPAHSASSARPWQAYNYSPSSRTVAPTAIHSTVGDVSRPSAVLKHRTTRISGAGSAVTVDFGKEVGGIVSLDFTGSSGPQQVGLAFSESSMYVGTSSDASTGGPRSRDGSLIADVDGRTRYRMPQAYQRGGFRYLTIYLESGGHVDLDKISLHFTAAPAMKKLDDYANYFYSSDDLLNRIWYAGAYTTQLNTIDPKSGRIWEPPATLWDNTGDVGVGDTILVDGAKRDRTVWPGDLGIQIPAAYAAFNDTTSARNALTTIYQEQRPTGELPYAGPELDKWGSDTYHLWTLAATYDYMLYTDDTAWLRDHWSAYRSAIDFSRAKMSQNGLLSITGTSDSVRILAKGENLIANVLLWRSLDKGATLARSIGDDATARTYASQAGSLRTAINDRLWDRAAGAYTFYPDSTIHPQDGNSLAVWYGMTDADQARTISQELKGNWSPIASTAPENKGNPGVFSGSMEVNAHFAAGNPEADQAGVDIIRRQWGYMLDHPAGTKSTFWESYRNGEDCVFCSTYVSLAHGWAAGPTPALTSYVLGLEPTTAGGDAWSFVPHTADLTFAQGRITTTHGAVTAGWSVRKGTYRATVSAPRRTTGTAGVPTFGRRVTVKVDGRTVWDGRRAKASGVSLEDGYVRVSGLTAGKHSIVSSAARR